MDQRQNKSTLPHAFGVVRLCYPARDGFRVEHTSVEERRAFLYNPARLALRLDIFEAVTLASYAAQRDKSYTLALMVGDQMPTWAVERLLDMLELHPQIALCPMREGRHIRLAVRDVFASMSQHHTGPMVQFRQDDDDAVNAKFIGSLRRAAKQHMSLLADHPIITLDFAHGTHALITPEGLLTKTFERSGLGLALGCLIQEGEDFCIYDENHDDLIAIYPAPKLDLPYAYLRLYHRHNDCFDPASAILQDLTPLSATRTKALCKRMGINSERLLPLGGRVAALASS